MRKMKNDMEDINSESLKLMASHFPNGFSECEVIRFTLHNGKQQDRTKRTKLVIGDTAYLIKGSSFRQSRIARKDGEEVSPYLMEAPDSGL